MNCNNCGAPMKFVQAGVSKKTGNAYDAFWSCPNGKERGCKTVKAEKKQGNPNGGMEIIGEVLGDIQVKVNKILEILNKEMPTE